MAMNNASRLDGRALWLATDTGALWLVDLAQRTAESVYMLNWPALTLAEETGKYLWAANAATGILTVIDLATDEPIDALGFGGAPPTVITYDGAMVWFAYGGARQQVVSVGYDQELRALVEMGPSISLSGNTREMAINGDGIYVTSPGVTILIDPFSNTIVRRIGTGEYLSILSSNERPVWGGAIGSGFIYPVN